MHSDAENKIWEIEKERSFDSMLVSSIYNSIKWLARYFVK